MFSSFQITDAVAPFNPSCRSAPLGRRRYPNTHALDRPLFILANVEVSATTSSGACYSSLGTRCTGEPDSFASSASAATISLLDSSNGVLGSTEVTGDFETDANLVAYTSLTDYAFGHQRTLAQSITLPMAWVYEIPFAGTYTVNLDVVTDGEVDGCSLTVLQP